jgi:hypothetical protein
MVSRKQRVRESDREGTRQEIGPKNMLPVTYFLQLGPTFGCFHHCPIMPSNYECFNGLIHWLMSQSPHELVGRLCQHSSSCGGRWSTLLCMSWVLLRNGPAGTLCTCAQPWTHKGKVPTPFSESTIHTYHSMAWFQLHSMHMLLLLPPPASWK